MPNLNVQFRFKYLITDFWQTCFRWPKIVYLFIIFVLGLKTKIDGGYED